MLSPVESVLEGTWAGSDDDLPVEWLDFELMAGMHWNWADLKLAPAYVRRYCRDFLRMRAEANRQARGKG